MLKYFNADSKFMRLLNTLADLITLNVLWLVCSLPVITIGPSTTALYTCIQKIVRKESPAISQTFFRAFRDSFKPAMLLSLVLLVPVVLVTGYLFLTFSGALQAFRELFILCVIAIAIVAAVCSMVFPLLANFENTVSGTMRNAVALLFVSPGAALAAAATNLLPVILMLNNFSLFFRLLIFYLLLGEALTAFLLTHLFNRTCFKKAAV